MPIKMINVGLSGFTRIMTSRGYELISNLADTTKDIWNGETWVPCHINMSESPMPVFLVEVSDGSRYYCAADNKFAIIKDGKTTYTPASMLSAGDRCEPMKTLPIIRKNMYHLFVLDTDVPPVCGNIAMQAQWLANRLDKDAGCMQITSDDKNWLSEIQLMAHCLGTMPFICESPRGFHLRFASRDARMLITSLRIPIDKKVSDYCFVEQHSPRIVSVSRYDGLFHIYSLCAE